MARNALPDAPDSFVPPVKVPRLPRQPRQRRPGMIVLSVLLAVIGALASYYVVHQLSDRVPVLVMLRDVPVGQQISLQDVTTAMVAVDSTVATLSGHELNRVVGMTAKVDLHSGELLSGSTITDQVRPVVGEELVPVALKPSRLPVRSLKPGDVVFVVPTPGAQTDPGTKPTRPIEATVDRVSTGADTDGLIVVDLLVTTDNSQALARQAAEGQVALVLTPRRP